MFLEWQASIEDVDGQGRSAVDDVEEQNQEDVVKVLRKRVNMHIEHVHLQLLSWVIYTLCMRCILHAIILFLGILRKPQCYFMLCE